MTDTSPATGHRLSVGDLRLLAALTRDGSGSGDTTRLEALEFVAAGVVTEEGAALSEAINGAVALVALEVQGLGLGYRGQGWVSEELSVLAIPAGPGDDPLCEVIFVETARLPTVLARFVELGPRARRLPDGHIYTRRTVLDRLLGQGAGATREAIDELLDGLSGERADAWLASLTSPRALRWRVDVSALTDPDGLEPLRTCEAIDCGEHGMWAVADSPGAPDQILLVAATPSHVWRLLSSIFSEPRPGLMPDVASEPAIADLL